MQSPSRTSGEASLQGNRLAASLVLLVIACLPVVAWAVWCVVPARWNSPGYPSYVGYGKNVEHAAVILAGLTSVLLCIGLPRRWIRRDWACAALIPALVLSYRYCTPETYWLPPVLILANVAYFSWYYRQGAEAQPPGVLTEPWPKAVSVALLASMMVVGAMQGILPRPPDLFGDGEIVLTAQEWQQGGIPFETMFWPHGLHDSGVTAFFGILTGNQGMGALLLCKAVTNMLGLVALFVIGLNVLRRWADSVVAAGLIGASFSLFLFCMNNAVFVVLACHLIARRKGWLATFAAGVLLGWSYLWRFDYGVFGLAAVLGFLAIDKFYSAYCESDRGWRVVLDIGLHAAVIRRAAVLAAGVAACFALCWAILGIPNVAMFSNTLWELPKYHADNTGYPLILPLRGFDQFPCSGYRIASWVTVQTIVFATCVAVFLLLKAREKRLALSLAEDRFCFVMSLFCLLCMKTLLDRCDLGHAFCVFAVWTVLFGYDLWARAMNWSWPHTVRLGSLAVAVLVCVGGLYNQMLIPGRLGTVPLWQGIEATWRNWPRPDFAASLKTAQQCFAPTQSWEELLGPADFAEKAAMLQEVRQLRHLLDQHEIGPRGLLATHSGPLLYSLVDRFSPTRYYLLGWAMSPRMRQQAIAELRSNQLQAVLRLNGYMGTLGIYDVPDEHRIPEIHEFIANHIATWPAYSTRFGQLYVHGSQRPDEYLRLQSSIAGEQIVTPDRTIRVTTEGAQAVLDHRENTPQHVLLAGWAADVAVGAAPDRLLAFVDNECVFAGSCHVQRPDVVQAFGKPQLLASGFAIFLPRCMVPVGSEHRLRLFAVLNDRAVEIPARSATSVAEAPSNTTRK